MRLAGSTPEGSAFWRLLKLFAAALAVLLVGGLSFTAVASAQVFDDDETECEEFDEEAEEDDADTAACLEQDGDNEAESDSDFEGTGGDGVAGSNVIGTAGTGDTDITANNNSRFADAEGGDVTANSNTEIDNGPDLTVEGGEVDVTSIATGISTVSQVATPTLAITLNQVSSSTGAPSLSNSVTGLTTVTGVNSLGVSLVSSTAGAGGGAGAVSGTATGAAPVTQTLNQTAATNINNVFAPVVTTTATNLANVTGSAPVNQTGAAITSPTATATAGPNTTRALLSQEGDNEVEADFDATGVGGDGVAGSNIIGVAGAGDTSISADNRSRFDDAEGGSTEFLSNLVVDNGPDLTVSGGDTTVVADAFGSSSVNQTAAPTLGLTVSQTATATGPSALLNGVTANTNVTGANIVSPTAGPGFDGPIDINIVNNQTLDIGPINCNNVVGICVSATQSPIFNINFGPLVSGTVLPFGPINQTLNQTGTTSVTNTFAPVINTTAANAANVTGSTPVTQSATAISSPTAIALAGPNTTRGALFHAGDNIFESDVDGEGTGGDGIAGSNVIGVAGAGRTTIDATNDSAFSDAQGGDTFFEQNTTADNGPTVAIEGGDVNVTAIATGIADVDQTATPTVTIDLDQAATATGPSTVSNTVSAVTSLTGTNIITGSGAAIVSPTGTGGVTPTAGTITQSLTQSGSTGINNAFTPTVTTQTSNTSTLNGSSGVNQTATSVSNPTAVAIAP